MYIYIYMYVCVCSFMCVFMCLRLRVCTIYLPAFVPYLPSFPASDTVCVVRTGDTLHWWEISASRTELSYASLGNFVGRGSRHPGNRAPGEGYALYPSPGCPEDPPRGRGTQRCAAARPALPRGWGVLGIG